MRTRRNSILLVLVAILALLGGACAADEPERDAAGNIEETEDVSPNSLQVGDCFNDPEDTAATQVTALEAVPCEEPHDNEVFHVFDIDDGDFPGTDEVRQLALDACEPELEAYVGASAADAGLAIVPVTPTEQSWNDRDDRTVLCGVYAADGTVLTGSLEGTANIDAGEEPAGDDPAN